MEIRDVKEVYRLEKQCFSLPWSENSIQKEVDNEQALFCVYEKEEKVVAYAGMYYVCGEGDITNVAVEANSRRKGIAKKLLLQMFKIAQENNVNIFTLEVRESNAAAIKLYEQLGFICEGTRKNFYDNPKENGLIMWKR